MRSHERYSPIKWDWYDDFDLSWACMNAEHDLRTAEYFRYFKKPIDAHKYALSAHEAALQAYILAQRA